MWEEWAVLGWDVQRVSKNQSALWLNLFLYGPYESDALHVAVHDLGHVRTVAANQCINAVGNHLLPVFQRLVLLAQLLLCPLSHQTYRFLVLLLL